MMPLLLLAAAAAAPHPGEVKLFRDWTVGCDNGGKCEAVALLPQNGEPEDWLVMRVWRQAGPDTGPRIVFEMESPDTPRRVALLVDGRRIDTDLYHGALGAELNPRAIAPLLAALPSARSIELIDAKGERIGRISPAGAAAALLYMDDRQGRVGTPTAIVRKGTAPLPLPDRSLPVIRAAPPSARPPRAMPLAVAAKLRDEACGTGDPDDKVPPETYRLDAGHSLAYVPAHCLSGAYNQAALLLVAADRGPWVPAAYDVAMDSGGEGSPASLAFNASWNARTGRLSMFMKGRGLADCGLSQDFAWDGARFRLVRRRQLDECRGATVWIDTWNANVTRP
ncbi:MAG TPA: DUF1176 domain-containing protein [Allosphingosinicella sp.]|jgi:hypothetical protein